MTVVRHIHQPLAYVPVLAALHAEAFAVPWSEHAFASALSGAGTCLLIATADPPAAPDQPVGFVLLRQIVDEAEILTLMVRPSARRQGHGTQLLKAAIGSARENAARQLFLEVDIDNQAARKLYQTAQFTAIGQRQGYFKTASGTSSDAIIMRRIVDNNCPEVSGFHR
ncbi:MAG: ribosomal-protein-alanine N-acetyltransferase [Nisaea sp.]|jgi:ribosomal-protein-alanine N-acetyltransferase|nr:ribosomal-protein-alanine N-acetyltransferase [Nisaea sp.]OUX92543.1 MAG: ribosomal-protein-alanine N-acetyltransferase [Candidatus Endolissoclinum sp. TMED26]